MSIGIIKKHWIMITWPEWSRCRSALALCVRIVERKPSCHITFFTHQSVAAKAQQELDRIMDEDGFRPDIFKSIYIVGLSPIEDTKREDHGSQLLEAVIRAWPTIHPRHVGLPSTAPNRIIKCAVTSESVNFDLLPEPTVLINDTLAAPVAEYIRRVEMTGRVRIKLCKWYSTDISSPCRRHTLDTKEPIGTGIWNSDFAHAFGGSSISDTPLIERRHSEPAGSVGGNTHQSARRLYDFECNYCSFPAFQRELQKILSLESGPPSPTHFIDKRQLTQPPDRRMPKQDGVNTECDLLRLLKIDEPVLKVQMRKRNSIFTLPTLKISILRRQSIPLA